MCDDHSDSTLTASQLDFIAKMSHELRSPLNSMLILSRLLADNHERNLTNQQVEYAHTVHAAGQELLELVDSILDLARIESHSITLRFAPLDVRELFAHLQRAYQVQAKERGLELELDVDPDTPRLVVTDAQRLKQVMRNLISNAIKYTREGSVTLRAEPNEPGDGVRLCVEDTGIGIPDSHKEEVFKPFHRLERSLEGSEGGSGLGLAICRHLIEVLGGKVTLESSRKDGSCFTVELPDRDPMEAVPQREHVDTPIIGLRGAREGAKDAVKIERSSTPEASPPDGDPKLPLVLVVDDDPHMNEFMRVTLRDNFRVASAFDGPQGVEMARELRPDLIVTDVVMPGFGGDKMIDLIRDTRGLEDVPIIILTARTDDALRVKLLREGAQDFMIKPFLAEEMLARAMNLVDAKLARESLQAVNRELARTNSELEQFAYAASHDLAAPLRAIRNLTTWIEEDLEDAVESETEKHFELLRGRADRMAALLRDLLDYSRIGRVESSNEVVDVGELLDEIAILQPPPEGIELIYDHELPKVWAPRVRLQQIFMNLLSNACKHADDETSRVEVVARDDGEFWEFSVIDDGPGIPKQYHEDIFKMFKTLRPRDELEGSGMGLAIVKKAVENFGGFIELASGEDGRGATFRIKWPKSQRTNHRRMLHGNLRES